ncbi:hypothetical protein GGI43DRAFT_387319 [Trichoderma evansii]
MVTPTSATVMGAADRFRLLVESLPDEERQLFESCNDVDKLLDNIRTVESKNHRHRDGKDRRRYMELTRTVIEAMQPMFKILDTFNLVDPMQFGEECGLYSSKIATSLREISNMILFFKQVKVNNLVLESKTLKTLLESIFVEVLDYLAGIVGLFYTGQGKAKSRVRIYGGAALKPFRYDQVFAQLKEYRSAVTSELIRIQALQMHSFTLSGMQMQHRFEKESDEAMLQRFKQWLAPTTYTSRYEDVQSLRTPSTSQWIFDDLAYQKWLSIKDSSALLWIHGKPGAGKTILAATIVEHLKDADENPFYFFFDCLQSASKKSSDAYSAILSQILHKNPSNSQLLDLINFTILFATDGQPTGTTKEVADLFELCLQLTEFEGMTLVLDGLDECQDASKELMPLIKRMSSQTNIRLILLGRSTVRGYIKGISSVEDLPIGDSNSHDIQAYLKDELEACINDELLPKELNIEEGLEIMYERILVQIYKASRASFKLAAHVFTCLLYGNRPLKERELEDSVVSRKRGGIDEQSRTFPNFVDTILLVCGGFVERSQQSSFRFIHASVHDYFKKEPQRRLAGRSQFQDPILVSTRVAGNLRLATHCLEYINYALPEERLTPRGTARHQLEEQFPLSGYATSNWHAHMLATNGTLIEVQNAHKEEPDAYGDFISALCQLLSRPPAVSAWIQSCFAFYWEPPYLSLLKWAEQSSLPDFPWRQYSPQIDDIIPNIRELAEYLNRIITDWSVHLYEDPSCIYDEAAAFIKSEYATRPSDIAVKNLVSAAPASHLSSEPLHKISKLMPDGKQDYILSIYPPITYLEWSRHLDWDSDFSEIEQHSLGWVARLEIFDIEKSYESSIVCLEMNIDANEVLLQLSQSQMCSSSGAVIQFPISLSSDGRAFTILRTVYSLRKTPDEHCATSHVLAIDPSHQSWQPSITPRWKAHAGNLYLYWIYFDDQGQYLTFVEQFINHDLTVGVFSYNRTQSIDTGPQFIARISIPLERDIIDYYPGRNRREFELAYHPFVGAMVVAGYNKSAFLWIFEDPRSLHPLSDDSEGKLEMLSFTSDGKSVVWKRGGDLPFAISVESLLPSKSQSVRLLDQSPESSAPSTMIPRIATASINLARSETPSEKRNGDNESRLLELNPPVSSRAATFGVGAGAIRPYGSDALAHEPGKGDKDILLMVSDRRVVASRVPSPESDDNSGTTDENEDQKQLELRDNQNLILTRIPNWGYKAASPTVVLPGKRATQSSSSTGENRLSHQKGPLIVERQVRSIQRHNQHSAQKPLLLSPPEQPESNDAVQVDEDAEENVIGITERDQCTSTTGDITVIATSPAAEVGEHLAVTMPLTPNIKVSTTESPNKNAGPTKEKKFRKKLLGNLSNLLKRKPKV